MQDDALQRWKDEKQSVYLYRILADVEAGTPRQALFSSLADAADEQALHWARVVDRQGKTIPAIFRPDLRGRFAGVLVRRLGPRAVRTMLSALKVRGMSVYLLSAPTGHAPVTGGVETSHKRLGGGGNLRAAVFGVNDGLLSNASLIIGMAGASSDSRILVLTGIAGLLAGAFAMASGEYISVRSQRELHEYQIGLERAELAEYPDEEAAELALIYEAKGVRQEEARQLAKSIVADPEKALDALAREELGLNPSELGSPWGAALSSFVAFALGAVLPLLPFLLHAGPASLPIAIALTALSLFGIGAMLSLLALRGFVWVVWEQFRVSGACR